MVFIAIERQEIAWRGIFLLDRSYGEIFSLSATVNLLVDIKETNFVHGR